MAKLAKVTVAEPTELVFVYGTLRSTLHNSGYLHGAKLVGLDEVLGKLYILHHQGIYSIPAAKLPPLPIIDPINGPTVKGEVYEVTPWRLKVLDAIEGHPDSYRRTQVVTVGGRVVWVYAWPHFVSATARVEGGDWVQWVQAKMASKARR